MGYVGETLAGLAPGLDHGVERFARRATRKVGGELQTRVRRHTPVAKQTAAVRNSFDSIGHWIRSRGGRHPGELKGSWKVGTVDVQLRASGRVYTIDVYTLDPVAPYVEWPTRPHVIRPRRPGGVLTIPTKGGMIYATIVHHPGTRGSYMMATALAEVAALWQAIVAREWARETRTRRSFWTGEVG